MYVSAIINPISGFRGAGSLIADVAQRLRAAGCDVDIQTTSAPGDATRIARNLPEDAGAVLSVGGDGTLREIAQGMIHRPTPIVVVPTGTENVIARELGMNRRPSQIVDTVLRGRPRRCDVGIANGRCFLILAGVGFDGAVATRLAAERIGHISYLSYLGPLWRTLRTYAYPPVQVQLDESTVFNDRGLVFVGVMSRYSIGLRILRHAVWNDGLLDLCILPCAGTASLLVHAARVAAGRHTAAPSCIYLQGKALRISSDSRIPVQIDGEAAGTLPLEIGVRKEAVTLMTPRHRTVRGFPPSEGSKPPTNRIKSPAALESPTRRP